MNYNTDKKKHFHRKRVSEYLQDSQALLNDTFQPFVNERGSLGGLINKTNNNKSKISIQNESMQNNQTQNSQSQNFNLQDIKEYLPANYKNYFKNISETNILDLKRFYNQPDVYEPKSCRVKKEKLDASKLMTKKEIILQQLFEKDKIEKKDFILPKIIKNIKITNMTKSCKNETKQELQEKPQIIKQISYQNEKTQIDPKYKEHIKQLKNQLKNEGMLSRPFQKFQNQLQQTKDIIPQNQKLQFIQIELTIKQILINFEKMKKNKEIQEKNSVLAQEDNINMRQEMFEKQLGKL